jgi:hypothetical protein
MENGKNSRLKKTEKIPKGYRLKVKTHDKIKELQLIINGSQDMVIGNAIRLYFRKVQLLASRRDIRKH